MIAWWPIHRGTYLRVLAAAISVACFVGAGIAIATQGSSHLECSELAKIGHQEAECIGEPVIVPGPDRRLFFLLIFVGVIAALVCWKFDWLSTDDENTP